MPVSKVPKTLYRWRVRSGLFAAILGIVLSRPNTNSLLAGTAITLAGLGLRVWATGHLQKEKQLAVSGPYRFSRNPLYLGNFILGVGVVVGSRSWWMAGLFMVYFAVFYPAAISWESKRLKVLFPQGYEGYRDKVPSFFPTAIPPSPAQKKKFSWNLYKKNKEYRAALGAAIYWAALAIKMLFFQQ